jgi:hypothetical protein
MILSNQVEKSIHPIEQSIRLSNQVEKSIDLHD